MFRSARQAREEELAQRRRQDDYLRDPRGLPNAIVLPLYFISGVFVPESEIPEGVLSVAGAFPVRPFFQAFFTTWDPNTTGAGFEWGHLALVTAWGVAGLVIAMFAFRWEPRR